MKGGIGIPCGLIALPKERTRTIEALGLQQEAAKRFGSQGEGAIAGRWAEYAVSAIDAHHRFRYSRLACGGG